MSTVKGKGAGCYATYKKMAAEVGCDYTNFSKSISRLMRWGYLVREPQLMDRRKFTLRVLYGTEDSWRNDQQSGAEKVGDLANDQPEIVGDAANFPNEIVGQENSESRRNLPKTASHYISLKEELDFVETSEINSAKRRDLDFDEFSDHPFSDQSAHLDDGSDRAWQDGTQSEDNAPSAIELLEVAGWGIGLGQSLARYERLLKSNPQCIDLIECQGQLSKLLDEFGSDNEVRGQIERLWEATWEKHAELQRSSGRDGKSAGNRARR